EGMEIMKEHNIELSSEFMVLAAELIEIKTRMMLPRPVQEGEVLGVEDPRSELAERLLAYKQCKQQSELLAVCEQRQIGVFEKPQEDISIYLDNPDEYLRLDMDEFADAFRAFLLRKKRLDETRRHYTRVERERETIEHRMEFIRQTIHKSELAGEKDVSFRALVPTQGDRYGVAVSFASMLQMMRERYLDARQEVTFGDIRVFRGSRPFEDTEAQETTDHIDAEGEQG
ncbi:MAG: segregation/condensation protein A, partial [Eubacterium sp.]|nr:segregation/condensation protein A [Eubacterium sp.]